MVSTASFAQGTPRDLPILILNGAKDPVVAETVTAAADETGQAQTSIVLNGVGHGHLVDLFVQHAGCTDVTDVLYPEARHEVLAELDDVKLAATAEIVAFVERVCGENSVVSLSSSYRL
jgi:alpha-beta hydrolase superfamily lysophospholipase